MVFGRVFSIFLLFFFFFSSTFSANPKVSLSKRDDSLFLENGFVSASFDLLSPCLSSLQADFLGTSKYGQNVLMGPGMLIETGSGGGLSTHKRQCVLDPDSSSSFSSSSSSSSSSSVPSSSFSPSPPIGLHHLKSLSSSSLSSLELPEGVKITAFSSFKICVKISTLCSSVIHVSWKLCLETGARQLDLRLFIQKSETKMRMYGSLSGYLSGPSITATMNPNGVIQQMNALYPLYVFPPSDSLSHLYSMGAGSSLSLVVKKERKGREERERERRERGERRGEKEREGEREGEREELKGWDLYEREKMKSGGLGGNTPQFVLLNAASGLPTANYMPRGSGWWSQHGMPTLGKKSFFNSGFLFIFGGTVEPISPHNFTKTTVPHKEKRQLTTRWVNEVKLSKPMPSSPFSLSLSFSLAVNNYDFPVVGSYVKATPLSFRSHNTSSSTTDSSSSSSSSISSSSPPHTSSFFSSNLGLKHLRRRTGAGLSSWDYSSSELLASAWSEVSKGGVLSVRQQLKEAHPLLTAFYGTSINTLKTVVLKDGISPTLSFNQMFDGWEWGYFPASNFFDPDAFIGVSGVILSGDRKYQLEARDVIESSLINLSPEGQVPHHFGALKELGNLVRIAEYKALSGASQPGPNFFLILAALTYTKYSGDYDWFFCRQFPHVERATKFILSLYSEEEGLLNAPGPLMIDTLLRKGYQSDTNMFFVYFLKELADAVLWQSKLEVPPSGNLHTCFEAYSPSVRQQRKQWAEEMLEIRNRTISKINDKLWKIDHYWSDPQKDMGDHDSNFMAIAFGIAQGSRVEKIWQFLSKSTCLHRPSQKFYDGAHTYGRNTGDSDVRLARIALMEAFARTATRDAHGLKKLMDGIEKELIGNIWMYERYSCSSDPERSEGEHCPYFFEWPSIYGIIKVNSEYGIDLGLDKWTINPLGKDSFHFLTPAVGIIYDNQRGACISGPGPTIKRTVSISGFRPRTPFRVINGGEREEKEERVRSSEEGVLVLEGVTTGVGYGVCVVASGGASW